MSLIRGDMVLNLFMIFHLNLLYSSIPEEKRKTVIEKCYWPILRAVEAHGLPIGIEVSGYSLEVVQRLDRAWVKAFTRLVRAGRCELVGSGYAQVIGPLVPARVNEWNQRLGVEAYRRIIGCRPSIALVNEQAYSSGIIAHYAKAGYRAIAMEWNNPYKYHPEWKREWRYYPQYAVDPRGRAIPLVWNNAISFQMFQRYVHGEIGIGEYMAHLESNIGREPRTYSLYGNDAEIFDFRPGRFSTEAKVHRDGEWNRIDRLFEQLRRAAGFRFISPSAVLRYLRHPKGGRRLALESPEQPVPVKKQEKYNLSRWAVSGRNNSRTNAQCYEIFFNLAKGESLMRLKGRTASRQGAARLTRYWRELVYLWASDFRTSITTPRFTAFRARLGKRAQGTKEMLRGTVRTQARHSFLLANPHDHPWDRDPFEMELEFEKGRFFGRPLVLLEGKKAASQIEECVLYKDKSIRKARVVICPTLRPGETIRGSLGHMDEEAGCRFRRTRDERFRTDAVDLSIIPAKGAAIKSLIFKGVSGDSLMGTLPHGYFDDISFAADFFSGHTIVSGPFAKQVTDLNEATVEVPERAGDFPLRVPIVCRVKLEIGDVTKRYYLYRNEPRVDLDFIFRVKRYRNLCFRVGMLTVNPAAFDRKTLRYCTLNGGDGVEEFRLKGTTVKHHEPVSAAVSSRQCVGATERWVSIDDGKKGVAVIARRGPYAPVPLVHYQEIDDRYFLRIYNSIAEVDDTTRSLWRGEVKVSFSYIGHKGDLPGIRRTALHICNGLQVR